MAIGFVQRVGLSAVGAGNPSVTVPAGGCALGNFLIAVYATNGATALTTPGITDTGGNSYQNDRIHDDGTGVIHVCISSAKITTALVSGNTITASPTGGGANRTLAVYEYSGLDPTSWVGQVNSAGGTSTSPNSGNLVTATNNELLIGACGYNLAAGGYAPGATGGNTPAEDDDNAVGGQAAKSVEIMHLLDLGAAGTYTANGTIASAVWIQAGVTYKAVSAVVTPIVEQIVFWNDLGPSADFGPNPFNDDTPPVLSVAQLIAQALTATVTTTATIVKQVGKVMSATATSTATIVKQVGKPFSATATVTASLVKQVNKLLSATATSTASVVAMKVILLALTATVTTTATITKQIGKAVTATATTTATMVKQVGKPLSATVTTLATITKQVGKPLSATVTATASLVGIKVILRTLSATVTTTATMTRSVGKSLTATATSTATVSRRVGKQLSATVASSATITKAVKKTLSAGVSVLADLVAFLPSAVRILFRFDQPNPSGSASDAPDGTRFTSGPSGTTGSSPDSSDFDPPNPRL